MSDLDPYQTPASSLEDTAHRDSSTINTYDWSLASRWQRLGAWFIDAILNGLATMTALLPLMWFDSDFLSEGLIDVLASVVAYEFYLLINGYWMAKDGQTVGKKLLGIYMVGYETNTILPLGHIVLRRYLPFWLLEVVPRVVGVVSVIDALFIFGQEKRCLHDLLAGTKVVAKPPLAHPPPAPPKWE